MNEIVQIKSNKDTDYGYQKMTAALALLGYCINHKKVYRIMKEQGLLNSKTRCTGKTRVRFRCIIHAN
ncbi:MAG: transposase [Saprospiraceae bacterium]|nr:transposase [Saprospiraceae bacterium]